MNSGGIIVATSLPPQKWTKIQIFSYYLLLKNWVILCYHSYTYLRISILFEKFSLDFEHFRIWPRPLHYLIIVTCSIYGCHDDTKRRNLSRIIFSFHVILIITYDIQFDRNQQKYFEMKWNIFLFNEQKFCTKFSEEYGLGQGLASPLKSDL